MSKLTWTTLSGWKKYLGIYLLLLILSYLTVWAEKDGPIKMPEEDKGTVIQLQDSSDVSVTIRYENIYKGNKENPSVLLLLPGGPEGASVFDELVPHLSTRFRLIIPHLPGDGFTKKKLPSYSFRALSEYANQLLEKLHLTNTHVIGYGLGGASAIYLCHDHPQNVASLTLISSIGVQELALLGSYSLNHAIYGIQLGIVWFLHNAIPHFGLFDALDINVPYAKSYYQSDQRPLRAYLRHYRKPMLILHGRDDALAPVAVAREHRRIVPQSKLETFDADHDLVEIESDSVAYYLNNFIQNVEQGTAITSANASEKRIAESQKTFSTVDFSKLHGGPLYLLMFIIIMSTLISEDLTCVGSGLLVVRGIIGFWPATLACLIGIFMGDLGLYLVGRLMGRSAIRKAPFKWVISENDLKMSADWFEKRGPVIIFITRFIPGSRLPTYFTAGVIRAKFWKFAFYFLLAAMVWTPMLVGISRILGNQFIYYFSVYKEYAFWGFLAALVTIALVIKIVIPLFNYKGRKLLISRYRRLKHWEYWSPIILYFPVAVYIIYLGIKYQCFTLFTAANPSIPDSGFVGESKSNILHLFNSDGFVAKYDCISSSLEFREKLDKVRLFMKSNSLSFPIVLKPDVGQRGKGVKIIHNELQMRKYLANATKDTIVQEYIGGKEFGVFYYRHPNEQEGNIFSVTSKDLLSLTGDGQKTVEELILENDRTLNLAKFHLRENEERLYDVPEDGEEVPIVELGTHARGAYFEDGNKHISSELIHRMSEISNTAHEFYFGRFDLKVPEASELNKGQGVKIIEVNGVTSESTNIYDSKYSFWDAQKILMRQWRLAFEIGKRNHEQGAEVTPLTVFLKRIFQNLFNP